MAAGVPRVAEELPERENVIQWRQKMLERAGYPAVVAAGLAERVEVDLHLACELLERGSSVELALDIIL